MATLSAMVRHHLLLPHTATRRNIEDEATVQRVVDTLDGDPVLLELLHALAEVDSLATGPGVWSDWKASLVADLVARAAADGGGAARHRRRRWTTSSARWRRPLPRRQTGHHHRHRPLVRHDHAGRPGPPRPAVPGGRRAGTALAEGARGRTALPCRRRGRRVLGVPTVRLAAGRGPAARAVRPGDLRLPAAGGETGGEGTRLRRQSRTTRRNHASCGSTTRPTAAPSPRTWSWNYAPRTASACSTAWRRPLNVRRRRPVGPRHAGRRHGHLVVQPGLDRRRQPPARTGATRWHGRFWPPRNSPGSPRHQRRFPDATVDCWLR